MKAEELEAMRRLLFYSVSDAAEHIGHCKVQSWRRWESNKRAVPNDVAERIKSLVEWRQNALKAALEQMDGAPDVAVIWYRSVEDWMTMPKRSAAMYSPHCSVVAESIVNGAQLVPFDAGAYFRWLDSHADNESKRGEWAGISSRR